MGVVSDFDLLALDAVGRTNSDLFPSTDESWQVRGRRGFRTARPVPLAPYRAVACHIASMCSVSCRCRTTQAFKEVKKMLAKSAGKK